MVGVRARVYDALTSFFGRQKATRGKSKTGEAALAGWNGPYHGVPGAWAGEAARQVMEYQGWVYTAVNFIATQFSACQPCAVRVLPPGEMEKAWRAEKAWRSGRGSEPPVRRFVPPMVAKSASGTKPYAEEYEYLPYDNPLQKLLVDPNEPFTGYDLWYLAEVYMELTGTAYLYKHRDGSGRVAELWNMPSQWVNPCGEGKANLIDFYELNPNTRMSGTYEGGNRIEPEDIIRVRKPSPFNLVAGYSPVQSNAAEIDTYKQVTAVRYLSLQNGMSVGAVLQSEAGAEELSTEAMNRLEAKLAGHYGGVFNSGRTLVLNKGWKWEFPPAGRELEFIQTQDQLRKHILAGFGIDESHLMSAEATYAAAIDNRRKVRMDVVDPRLRLFAASLTERLAKDEFGDEYRVIYPDIPQETPQEKKERLELLASNNAITTNELRTEYGLEPRDEPEADQLMGDAATMPLGADTAAWDGDGELMKNDPALEDTKLEDLPVDANA